jgi:hypothetical protein
MDFFFDMELLRSYLSLSILRNLMPPMTDLPVVRAL